MQKKHVLIQMHDLRVGNGIAACLMNYYAYTVRHGYQIDFLVNRNIESKYVDTARKYGSRIFVLPHDTGKPNAKNYAYINKILQGKYDIFHVNITGLNALTGLQAARKANIPVRIYHAHNPRETSSKKAYIRSLVYETPCVALANRYIACSHHAGDSLFRAKNYHILTNAMDTSQFTYDPNAREQLRREWNMQDAFVVGVVGRFAEQKNPYMIIDIFAELVKLLPEAVLIWAGDGGLRNHVEQYAVRKGVLDRVKLLGPRTDVNKLYSAMDVFLLPSKFEGLGLVFIEAQIAGLHCFGSDCVPRDVEISDRMHRVDLRIPPKKWAEEISKYKGRERTDGRNDAIKAGFEIRNAEDSLIKLYEQDIYGME